MAQNQLLQLKNRRTIIGLLCFMTVCCWGPLWVLFRPTGGSFPFVRIIDLGLRAVPYMVAFLAAASVQEEIVRRTLMMVMARPVESWEYLLGRALGLACVAWACTALIVLSGAAAMLAYGTEPLSLLWQLAPNSVAFCLPEILIAIVAGALTSRPTTVSLFIAMMASNAFLSRIPADGPQLLVALQSAFYYLSMVTIGETQAADTLRSALVNAENLLYAVMFFMAGATLFDRRDVPMREA